MCIYIYIVFFWQVHVLLGEPCRTMLRYVTGIATDRLHHVASAQNSDEYPSIVITCDNHNPIANTNPSKSGSKGDSLPL